MTIYERQMHKIIKEAFKTIDSITEMYNQSIQKTKDLVEFIIKESKLPLYSKYALKLRLQYGKECFKSKDVEKILDKTHAGAMNIIKNLLNDGEIEDTTPYKERNKLYKIKEI